MDYPKYPSPGNVVLELNIPCAKCNETLVLDVMRVGSTVICPHCHSVFPLTEQQQIHVQELQVLEAQRRALNKGI